MGLSVFLASFYTTSLESPIQLKIFPSSSAFAGAATSALTASLSRAEPKHPPTRAAPAEVTPLRDAFKGQFLMGNAIDYPSFRGQNTMEADIAARLSAPLRRPQPQTGQRQHVEADFRFDGGYRLFANYTIISRRLVTL